MKRTIELWTSLVAPGSSQEPRGIAARARRLESDGWSGAVYSDSQLLAAEAFSVLMLCAATTTRLKLGTGTSNPATRHPSVIASAAAAVQVASNGRMSLSIGRGDSSLAYIGASPVPLAYFERAVAMLQQYLRGEGVPIAEAAAMLNSAPAGFKDLAIGSAPETSQLKWLPSDYSKPELEVAATGPKVIALAARHADCVSFALGANVERLKWSIGEARQEMERIGRDPASLRFGAYIPLYPHPDIAYARQISQGMVASMSRFSIMNKKVVGPVTEKERVNLERVASTYDMGKHGDNAAKQSQALDADFIDQFGLVGDPQGCVDRILEIIDLGIDKLIFWTADTEGRPGESYQLAAGDVMPKVMAAIR